MEATDGKGDQNMDEKKAREVRQGVFNGDFGCSFLGWGDCEGWECHNCPACMASHQHHELFGENGSQVPEGWEGYK